MELSVIAALIFVLLVGALFGAFLMLISIESEARKQKSDVNSWSAINAHIRQLEIEVYRLRELKLGELSKKPRAKGKRGNK